jgi:hypothetical protein
MRLSIRAFAAHLGVDARTVNKWEARGSTITLRPDTQALMDTALGRAPDDVKVRFTKTVGNSGQEQGENNCHSITDGELLAAWEAGEADRTVSADLDEFERFTAALANPQRTDDAVVTHLARILAQQRRAEDTLGGRRLLPSVLTQIKVIDGLARDARDPVRTGLLGVASHYNQFAGWMYQDAADTAGALRHYDAAMEAAQIIDDADMVTSVLSLKSHLAWSVGDPARAVGLAQAGQRQPHRVSDAVLALIAQQEARGHALDGAADATERALDRSTALTYTAAEHPEQARPRGCTSRTRNDWPSNAASPMPSWAATSTRCRCWPPR